MARTVTYKRRTKTGKISTVTRRVSGDSPIPSGAEVKRELRRAYKTAGRVKRKAVSVGSKVKKKIGQIGDTRTIVRSKTESVTITGPKFGTGKTKKYGTGVITGPKGFGVSPKKRRK